MRFDHAQWLRADVYFGLDAEMPVSFSCFRRLIPDCCTPSRLSGESFEVEPIIRQHPAPYKVAVRVICHLVYRKTARDHHALPADAEQLDKMPREFLRTSARDDVRGAVDFGLRDIVLLSHSALELVGRRKRQKADVRVLNRWG